MAIATIPKWLKKGAVIRVFDDFVVTAITDNKWIWMWSESEKVAISRHISQLGKKMERKRAAKKAKG
jgi:hypothetical protein